MCTTHILLSIAKLLPQQCRKSRQTACVSLTNQRTCYIRQYVYFGQIWPSYSGTATYKVTVKEGEKHTFLDKMGAQFSKHFITTLEGD